MFYVPPASTNSRNYLKFEFHSEKYLKTRQLIKLAFNSSSSFPLLISLTVVAVSVSASRFASRGNKHIFYASYIFYGTIIFQLEQEPFCLLRAAINEMLQWPSTKLSWLRSKLTDRLRKGGVQGEGVAESICKLC